MAPLTKLEDQIGLGLGGSNGSSSPISLTDANDQTSRYAMMQMVFALLLLIGENMSKIQKSNSELQVDEQSIAQAQATGAQTNETLLTEQLSKLQQQQEHANIWKAFGNAMKWIGVGLSLLIGGLLCETGIGFVILAATVAFTASPGFSKTTEALANEIAKIPGIPQAWANIISQAVVLVAVTVLSMGTESATAGMKFGLEAAEDVGEEASALSKVISKINFSAATTEAFLQTLMSSNLIPELIGEIPGVDKHPWIVDVISIAVQIVIAVAALKFSPTAGTEAGDFLSKLGPDAKNFLGKFGGLPQLMTKTVITNTSAAIQTLAGVLNGIADMGTGFSLRNQSETQKTIAPIQAQLSFGEGIMGILTQISSRAQESSGQIMKTLSGIFNINFSADMQALNQYQQYQG